MRYPKITIVVVNYNLGAYLEEALRSVLDQKYPNLECLVVDGGSNDDSVDIISRHERELAWWVSEPDQGQYHGLQKGFQRSTGEIMGWLNSDDRLHANSLFAVAEIFSSFKDIKWLTGLPTSYGDNGYAMCDGDLALARWSQLRYLSPPLKFIQQESTFWRRDLWELAGGRLSSELRLASDFELFSRFFRYERLFTTNVMLGGFRFRQAGQRSRDAQSEYLAECRTVVRRELARMGAWRRLQTHFWGLLAAPIEVGMRLSVPFCDRLSALVLGSPPVVRFKIDEQRFQRAPRPSLGEIRRLVNVGTRLFGFKETAPRYQWRKHEEND